MTKVIRHTHDERELNPFKTISTDKLILRFLSENPNSEFGKIREYVKCKGVNYSERKSVHLRLDSLRRLNLVGRIPSNKQGHYLYYLTKKATGSIAIQGELFTFALGRLLHNSNPIIDGKTIKQESNSIEKIIMMIGFYTLFVELQRWKFASKNKSHSENNTIMQDWLKNALTVDIISNHITQALGKLIKVLEFEKFDFPIYLNDELIKQVKNLEKHLQVQYPEAYSICKDTMDSLPKRISIYNEIILHDKKFADWITGLTRRTKKVKNRLKPNECPRCHYDGVGPVKSGPFKGRTDLKGFSIKYSNEMFKYRECGLCNFVEKMPILIG